MGVLVLQEVYDLDAKLPFGLVAVNEFGLLKVSKAALDIHAIRREDGHLDALRAILKASRSVSQRPKPDEQ